VAAYGTLKTKFDSTTNLDWWKFKK
jgi:hypothetical protein